MRYLALSLLLLIAAPVRAAEEPKWRQVLLTDWLYPGEESYEALKSAALQTNSQSWLAARMKRGEKIPQASARELAFSLCQMPGVDAGSSEKLARLLADEPVMLKDESDGSAAKRVQEISKHFDKISSRMDEIEALFDKNRYGKGSSPAVNFDSWAGYREDQPTGMFVNSTRGYMLGGFVFTLRGTLDKANYTIKLAHNYNYENAVGATIPFAKPIASVGSGFSFLFPVGDSGVEVHLGDDVDLKFSPLIFSGVKLANRDGFFADISTSWRPPKLVKEIDLNYPYDTISVRGLVLKKQGANWWLPFSNFQFAYAPQREFWEPWGLKINTTALRVDEEFAPSAAWLEKAQIYGAGVNVTVDEDQTRVGFGSNPDPQNAQSYAAGLDLRFSTGGTLFVEGATANFYHDTPAVPKTKLDYHDTAWIANISHPLGPVNVGIEAGMAGPRFLTKSRYPSPNPAQTKDWAKDRYQSGATMDTTYFNQFPNAKQPLANNMSWVSLMSEPAVMNNNSQRMALKTQWNGSWLSLGLYDGTASQIEASGPFVVTRPFIEGTNDNGYGWFRLFGQNYSYPPAPLLNVAPPAGTADNAMWKYNRPTDGNAIYGPTAATVGVHWQEIAQLGYREGQFTYLMSKDGVGDAHVLPDSIKTTNYFGGTVKVDFKAIFGTTLPYDLTVIGENRDLAGQPGFAATDGSNYFNQAYEIGFLTLGITEDVNFLAMMGNETWKSSHSFYPLNIQIKEYGAGADFKLDPLLSGLLLVLRGTLMSHEDLNISSKEFSLWTLSIGTSLTY